MASAEPPFRIAAEPPWLVIAAPGTPMIRFDVRDVPRMFSDPTGILLGCGAIDVALECAHDIARRVVTRLAAWRAKRRDARAPGPFLFVGARPVFARDGLVWIGDDVAYDAADVEVAAADGGVLLAPEGGVQAALALLAVRIDELAVKHVRADRRRAREA